jgi:hypothetical protein
MLHLIFEGLLLLAVDLEQKTSSRGKLLSTFPCGLCDHFVTWKCENTDHVLNYARTTMNSFKNQMQHGYAVIAIS